MKSTDVVIGDLYGHIAWKGSTPTRVRATGVTTVPVNVQADVWGHRTRMEKQITVDLVPEDGSTGGTGSYPARDLVPWDEVEADRAVTARLDAARAELVADAKLVAAWFDDTALDGTVTVDARTGSVVIDVATAAKLIRAASGIYDTRPA